LDIRLPGTSGIEACEEITKKFPDIRVIMLTSYAEDDMLFSAIRAGASGYVLKQIGAEDLMKAIEAVGRGEAMLDPGVTQRVFQEVRRAVKKKNLQHFQHFLSRKGTYCYLFQKEGRIVKLPKPYFWEKERFEIM
jgi:DNA-binding NarL/FixJ family response regulator